MDLDLELALKLHNEINNSPPKTPVKKTQKPSKILPRANVNSIVDPEWEYTDPNPDIHSLFLLFDNKYFWGRLNCVEVKWSPRMYSCAGICTYKGKLGGCVISLSLPLLKLRPRKDLVETLLHEMIHAFLFVADRNRERGEHGPKFHEHMHRINKEAGTKITVYHTFHDEVKLYKQHWWRCNGPCQNQKPFFGLVKRSMNRAPGPNDFWFAEHQARCGGVFIKVKEPEGFKSRKRGGDKINEKCKKKGSPSSTLHKYIPAIPNGTIGPPIGTIKNENSSAKIDNYKKISNVHGFTNLSTPSSAPNYSGAPVGKFGGTGLKSNKGGTLLLNPKTSIIYQNDNSSQDNCNKQSDIVPFFGSGQVLGGSSNSAPDKSKSRLLNLYSSSSTSSKPSTSKGTSDEKPSEDEPVYIISDSNESIVHCPVCNKKMAADAVYDHLEDCSGMNIVLESTINIKEEEFNSDAEMDLTEEKPPDSVICPACGKVTTQAEINQHLDKCLL